MSTIKAIRGMNDLLPEQIATWQYLEDTIRELVSRYGYQEIRTPVVERAQLFSRSIGDATDIIEKEMYCFLDRNQESLALRPEGTAGVVRAGIEHGILFNQEQRLWYMESLFRYEKPQKGRYRQFHQFGVEVFGLPGPDIDVEVILLSARLWKLLGIEQSVELHINSLGSQQSRENYRLSLVDFFSAKKNQLDEDSLKRLDTNPLRILDSKNPQMQALIEGAPKLLDCLDDESKQHFEQLCQLLTDLNIQYVINPRLVRGLDYYNQTVFEWMTSELGAQGTICGGGRYDGLVSQLGGKQTPAIGFGMGLERVVLMLQQLNLPHIKPKILDAYLITQGEKANSQRLQLAESIRNRLPKLNLYMHSGTGSFKKQIKKADKSGATWALIVAEDEYNQGQISIKPLREDAQQETWPMKDLEQWYNNNFT